MILTEAAPINNVLHANVSFQVQMFAPDANQMHVVNHCEGKPTEEKRNILQESARIARGDVTDLAKLDASAFDVAIIPGWAGRAINECCRQIDFTFPSAFSPRFFCDIKQILCVLIQGALVWRRT